MVRPESNSRPPASQPDAQPTESPVRGADSAVILKNNSTHKIHQTGKKHQCTVSIKISIQGLYFS
mgnify:CR=1 FL=1